MAEKLHPECRAVFKYLDKVSHPDTVGLFFTWGATCMEGVVGPAWTGPA